MTTANDIVTQAAKKAGLQGLGQTLDGSDTNDALADLNDMLSQWAVKRWFVYKLDEYSIVSTGQTVPYTVGPGAAAQINTGGPPVGLGETLPTNSLQRPNRVEAAFLRQIVNTGLPIDYPLDPVPSREEWNNVALKTLLSFPKYFYYSPDMPLGNLMIYPYPNASLYELHITIKNPLQNFPSVNTVVNLPAEYIPALKFNLAKRLRQGYGKKADPELNQLAREARNVIEQTAIQIPEMTMPKILIRPGLYNIYSDQTY